MAQSYTGLSDLKSRVHRSGHDIGRKVSFTAKTGELLPVYWDLSSPNDYYRIGIQHFTRTLPVSTSAFTRIREYFDVYEVPLRQLWRNVDNAMLDMNKVNPLYSIDLTTPSFTNTTFPYVTTKGLQNYILSLCHTDESKKYKDTVGMYRAFTTLKLLTYLRYGRFFPAQSGSIDDRVEATFTDFSFLRDAYGESVNLGLVNWPVQDVNLNLFPLLAYQKVYSDFYRNTHWEERVPQTYNVDYMTTVMSLEGFPGTNGYGTFSKITGTVDAPLTNMFDLRYVDYNKDLFFGVNPDAQFGDEAVVQMTSTSSGDITLNGSIEGISDGGTTSVFKFLGDTTFSDTAPAFAQTTNSFFQRVNKDPNHVRISGIYAESDLDNPYLGNNGTALIGIDAPALAKLLKVSGSASSATFATQFSILALRQAEALQRYREVIGSGSYDVVSQIEKMFGYKMPANLSGLAIYRGGYAVNLDISDVTNTNLASGNTANVAGKGISSGSDRYEFTTSDYSCIMVLYHNKPLVDWNVQGPDPQLLCVDGQDFPKPAFDNIGMEPVTYLELMQILPSKDTSSFTDILGYQPRYYAWKTKTDDVLGAFATGELDHWVSPITPILLQNSLTSYYNFQPSSAFFKVHPQVLDSIFSVQVDSTYRTDQFLVNCEIDVKVVRSLSNDGLEY